MNNLFKILSISTACVSGVFATGAGLERSPNGGATPPGSFKLVNPIRSMTEDLGKKGFGRAVVDARCASKSVVSDLDDDRRSVASCVSFATASVGVSRHTVVKYLSEGFFSSEGVLSREKLDYLVDWVKTIFNKQSGFIDGLCKNPNFARDLKDINQVGSFKGIAFLYGFFLVCEQEFETKQSTTAIFGKFFLDALIGNKNPLEIQKAAFDKLETLILNTPGLAKHFLTFDVPTEYQAIRGLQTRVSVAPAEKIARERIEAEWGAKNEDLWELMKTSHAQAQAAEFHRKKLIADETESRREITTAFTRSAQSAHEELQRAHDLEKARNDAEMQKVFEKGFNKLSEGEVSGRAGVDSEEEALRTEMMQEHQTAIFALQRAQLMQSIWRTRSTIELEESVAFRELIDVLEEMNDSYLDNNSVFFHTTLETLTSRTEHDMTELSRQADLSVKESSKALATAQQEEAEKIRRAQEALKKAEGFQLTRNKDEKKRQIENSKQALHEVKRVAFERKRQAEFEAYIWNAHHLFCQNVFACRKDWEENAASIEELRQLSPSSVVKMHSCYLNALRNMIKTSEDAALERIACFTYEQTHRTVVMPALLEGFASGNVATLIGIIRGDKLGIIRGDQLGSRK